MLVRYKSRFRLSISCRILDTKSCGIMTSSPNLGIHLLVHFYEPLELTVRRVGIDSSKFSNISSYDVSCASEARHTSRNDAFADRMARLRYKYRGCRLWIVALDKLSHQAFLADVVRIQTGLGPVSQCIVRSNLELTQAL